MTTTAQSFRKDPDAVLDYGFDWGTDDWLESGETIVDSVWVVESGITKDSDSLSSLLTKIWLSGGTAGEQYRINNKVTTSAGRIDERSFVVLVENR